MLLSLGLCSTDQAHLELCYKSPCSYRLDCALQTRLILNCTLLSILFLDNALLTTMLLLDYIPCFLSTVHYRPCSCWISALQTMFLVYVSLEQCTINYLKTITINRASCDQWTKPKYVLFSRPCSSSAMLYLDFTLHNA
jgi:hypothetical protein